MQVEKREFFHWADWLVFTLMLLISAGAGIWHYKIARNSNTEEYLLGGSGLKLFPVSASLVASFISGITILGTPAEIYNFGTQYWITVISLAFSGAVVGFVYLPVFKRLDLNSVYEYLEIRFSRSVRIFISLIFVLDVLLYQSIVVYVPALALNQVSGINIHVIGCVICAVCVFYTVLGGIRAVVWTDALQVSIMVAAVITVACLGTHKVGGPSEIWRRAMDANRIEFLNFDSSPYTRHTVWTVLIGSWVYSTAYISVNQTMVQRYKSLVDEKTCKVAIGIFTVGITIFISICCWCGLVLLAHWSPPRCDPRATGLITADDQLLPAYVMEVTKDLHGIPGLFISGIFGAALSSLSVGFNSISVVLLEDFVKGCFKMKLSDRSSRNFVKAIVILLGLIALAFIFLVEKLGGILVLTGSLAAIAAGTSFGVFTLGILFPWSNSKGALIGGIIGFLVSGWASFGANAAIGSGLLRPKKLPVSISHCSGNISEEFLHQFDRLNEENVFPLYRLSYHWFTGLGTIVVLIVGGIVTWLTGPMDPSTIDKNLLSPVIHRWLTDLKTEDDSERWQQPISNDAQTVTIHLNEVKKKSQENKLKEDQALMNGPI